MKALVLSGGGAQGAYEAGVASALLERERFDVICGVSIGAINAALIAAGRAGDALERFWLEEFPARASTLFPHLPRLRRLVGHLAAFGSGDAWGDAMRVARAATELPFLTRLGNLHKSSLPAVEQAMAEVVSFDRLRIPLLVGAANVTYGSATVFRAAAGTNLRSTRNARLIEYHDLDASNFVTALLASSAMPGLFSPIEMTFDGKPAYYADGSLVHASPLGIAIDNGATDVTVVFVDQEFDPRTANAVQSVGQQAYNIATLWQQRLLEYELRLVQSTNEVVRLGGAPGKRRISVRNIRPSAPIDVDILAFDDKAALAQLFARGRADGAIAPAQESPAQESPAPSATGDALAHVWNSLRRLFPRAS